MTKTLEGKVALVTGGSRGLGAAIAARLADLGADVAISYVASDAKAGEVVEALKGKGVRALAIRSDQGDPSAAKTLIERVVGQLGKLDVLVNNAAVAVQGHRIDDPAADTAALDQQWMTNVLGAVATTRAAAQRLTDGGRIVFIGSGLGTRVAFAQATEYAATKAALVGYARGASRDLGPRNITVNVVNAGAMMTDMGVASADKLPPGLIDLLSIKRMGTVEEVAGAVAYLVGPDAGYITGAELDISGGYQA